MVTPAEKRRRGGEATSVTAEQPPGVNVRPANEEGAVIELIEGLPDEVVGLEAVGEVTSDDYSSTAFPAVEAALSRHKKISLLHVLGKRFTGYEAGGGWADAKLGMLHALSWRRIAVVTDLDHIRNQVKRAGWLVPGEMKLFSNAQRPEAEAWVSAESQDEGGDRG